MVVQPLVLSNIVPESREEDKVVEPLGLVCFHVGSKQSCGFVHGTSRPVVRFCEIQNLKSESKWNTVYIAIATTPNVLTSSQFERDGITLKAFGNLPDLYLAKIFPTLHNDVINTNVS